MRAVPSVTPVLDAADPAAIKTAARILAEGGLVAVPTETVYGLACDATNPAAVAASYEAKGRPRFNPLIAHVDTIERARALVRLDDGAERLADAFWPGPLTLVAPKAPAAPVCDLASAGLDTLAVRLPAAPAVRALVTMLDRPLAAPSANRSGAVSPTRADHVLESLGGRIHLVLDGGPCPVGLESTIVAATDGALRLLRPGGVARADLEQAAGRSLLDASSDPARPQAPGQLTSHYAPKAAVRLNATLPEADEAYLAFGSHGEVDCVVVFNLSPSASLAEAATNLFSGLRALDTKAARIAVSPIPDQGIGEAINDRLRRAAADRP